MNGFQSQYRTVLPTELHVIALLMIQKPNSASMQFNRFMESQMLAIMETGIIHILGNTDLFALHKANLIYYTYPKAYKRKRHPIYILQLLFSAVQMHKTSPRRLLQIVRQASSLIRDNVAKINQSISCSNPQALQQPCFSYYKYWFSVVSLCFSFIDLLFKYSMLHWDFAQ